MQPPETATEHPIPNRGAICYTWKHEERIVVSFVFGVRVFPWRCRGRIASRALTGFIWIMKAKQNDSGGNSE